MWKSGVSGFELLHLCPKTCCMKRAVKTRFSWEVLYYTSVLSMPHTFHYDLRKLCQLVTKGHNESFIWILFYTIVFNIAKGGGKHHGVLEQCDFLNVYVNGVFSLKRCCALYHFFPCYIVYWYNIPKLINLTQLKDWKGIGNC